jgi:hypothetical protein
LSYLKNGVEGKEFLKERKRRRKKEMGGQE